MARILLIEDDDSARVTLTEIMRLGGHEVVAVPNGVRGLRVLAETSPDVIVTDIFMPDKDGIETILELRERENKAPIIAISGGGELAPADYLETAKRLGAAATLRKPFSRDVLLGAIAEVLGG